MELSTNDFIAEFGEELQTRHYDEIQAARDAEMEPMSNDERLAALGEESYERLEKLMKKKGIDLEDLAKSCGISSKQLREGVKKGQRFPRKPGVFDKMCRRLGFQPSEARTVLRGIYEARARGERIDTRMSANEKLREMHAVYQMITDPADRRAAEVAIDGLWYVLNNLSDNKG